MISWYWYVYLNTMATETPKWNESLFSPENLQLSKNKALFELQSEYRWKLVDLKNPESDFYKVTQAYIKGLKTQWSPVYQQTLQRLPDILFDLGIPQEKQETVLENFTQGTLLWENYIAEILIPKISYYLHAISQEIRSPGSFFPVKITNNRAKWELHPHHYSIVEIFDNNIIERGLDLRKNSFQATIDISQSSISHQADLEETFKHELRHAFMDFDAYNFLLISSQETKETPYPFFELYPRIQSLKDFLVRQHPNFFSLDRSSKENFLVNLYSKLNRQDESRLQQDWSLQAYQSLIIYHRHVWNLNGLVFLLDNLVENTTPRDLEEMRTQFT